MTSPASTPAFPLPPPHIVLKMYGDDIYIIHSKGVRTGLIKYAKDRKHAIASIEVWTEDVVLLRYVAEVIDYLNGLVL